MLEFADPGGGWWGGGPKSYIDCADVLFGRPLTNPNTPSERGPLDDEWRWNPVTHTTRATIAGGGRADRRGRAGERAEEEL